MMDYSSLLSRNIESLKPSGIRRFFDIAAGMKDVISLGVGEPDFKTPWIIRKAAIETLDKGRTAYTANAGTNELRDEIARYMLRRFSLSFDPANEIVVTVGGSEAIDICLRALINPGDEVIVPSPAFVCYDPLARMCGARVIAVETKAEDGFRLTPSALKAAISDKTKVLILNYPNNPTGAVMRKEHLEEIATVLRDTNIIVISDEIYAELTYNGEHSSIASLPGMKERTVVVNGFSKCYSMTGWRLGYACGPEPIIRSALKLHQFAIMSAPTTSQLAAVTAMREGDAAVVSMHEEYDRRRRYIVHAFNGMGLRCFEPEGAFYIFPSIERTGLSSDEFCERLLYEKQVAVIPGTAFGACGEGFVRVSYCYSLSHIMEACKRIEEWLGENT